MNAIDTNVFIYAFDDSAPAKQIKARALIDELSQINCDTVLHWQVASEFLNWLRKEESKGHTSAEDVGANFREILMMFPLCIPSADCFSKSFDLRSRYSLSHWDSLLLAACREAGVTKLYSEDLQYGADYDGVAVFNPFA